MWLSCQSATLAPAVTTVARVTGVASASGAAAPALRASGPQPSSPRTRMATTVRTTAWSLWANMPKPSTGRRMSRRSSKKRSSSPPAGSPRYWRQSDADEAHQLLAGRYLDRLDSELVPACRDLDDTQLARDHVTFFQSGGHP